jgi:hypothetical protein
LSETNETSRRIIDIGLGCAMVKRISKVNAHVSILKETGVC